jgi:DNA-binding MarR family transcriptional regulator
MSSTERLTSRESEVYQHLTLAGNYLRKLDDFYARAAAQHSTTLEHYQVLLAVHCVGDDKLALRDLAEHLVRDRTATGQLCRRMQQLGLLDLTYEANSHRPQLLVSLSTRGKAVLRSITEDGLKTRDQYLRSLPADKRLQLAEALRFSCLKGLDQNVARPPRQKTT